jgi:hypothetical protein
MRSPQLAWTSARVVGHVQLLAGWDDETVAEEKRPRHESGGAYQPVRPLLLAYLAVRIPAELIAVRLHRYNNRQCQFHSCAVPIQNTTHATHFRRTQTRHHLDLRHRCIIENDLEMQWMKMECDAEDITLRLRTMF